MLHSIINLAKLGKREKLESRRFTDVFFSLFHKMVKKKYVFSWHFVSLFGLFVFCLALACIYRLIISDYCSLWYKVEWQDSRDHVSFNRLNATQKIQHTDVFDIMSALFPPSPTCLTLSLPPLSLLRSLRLPLSSSLSSFSLFQPSQSRQMTAHHWVWFGFCLVRSVFSCHCPQPLAHGGSVGLID